VDCFLSSINNIVVKKLILATGAIKYWARRVLSQGELSLSSLGNYSDTPEVDFSSELAAKHERFDHQNNGQIFHVWLRAQRKIHFWGI
jgi:hypothetical protein